MSNNSYILLDSQYLSVYKLCTYTYVISLWQQHCAIYSTRDLIWSKNLFLPSGFFLFFPVTVLFTWYCCIAKSETFSLDTHSVLGIPSHFTRWSILPFCLLHAQIRSILCHTSSGSLPDLLESMSWLSSV